MKFIRIFLWGLIAAMTLQGYLKADEYGTAASMMGGISLTMSVWRESLGESTRSILGLETQFVPLPRALVVAALQETGRRPALHLAPTLQTALANHQRLWVQFREAEMIWMLQHADLVGALQSDPSARDLWAHLEGLIVSGTNTIKSLEQRVCFFNVDRPVCKDVATTLHSVTERIERYQRALDGWTLLFRLHMPTSTQVWLSTVYMHSSMNWTLWRTQLARLYDIERIDDPRVSALMKLAEKVNVTSTNPWAQRITASLMKHEFWAACILHVRSREGRVRDLMMMTGVQDLFDTHERVLNASMRVIASRVEAELVGEWFAEMASRAWWLGDDIPAIVRRCVGHETGECRRVGPTEIAALTAQFGERGQIMEDWVRRIFIGMWNALPALGLLFLMEMVAMCLGRVELYEPQRPQRSQRSQRLTVRQPLRLRNQ